MRGVDHESGASRSLFPLKTCKVFLYIRFDMYKNGFFIY